MQPTQRTHGSTAPALPTAVAPAPVAAPTPSLPADSSDFKLRTPVQLSGQLQLTLNDADGFARSSATDMTGSLSGSLRIEPAYVLARLAAAIKSDASKTITGITFDARKGAYVVTGRAHLPGLPHLPGPSFNITLKPGPDGQFEVAASSWADGIARLVGKPDATASLRTQLDSLSSKVNIHETAGHFDLDLLKGLTLPFGAFGGEVQIASLTGAPGFRAAGVDKNGAITYTLRDARFTGGSRLGTPTQAGSQADHAGLSLNFKVHDGNAIEANVTGDADMHLDGSQLAKIAAGNDQVLQATGKGAHILLEHIVANGTFGGSGAKDWRSTITAGIKLEAASGLVVQSPLTVSADGRGATEFGLGVTQIAQPLVGQLKIAGVDIKKDAQGLAIHVQSGGVTPFAPAAATTGNRLGLAIGGKQWDALLLDTIARAKQYVHGETFDFSEGDTTREVLTAMAQRAAGITLVNGQPHFDGHGIPIRVIVDSHGDSSAGWAKRSADTLRGQGKEPWALALRQAIKDGTGPYAGLNLAQREEALANMTHNLEFREQPGGALLTDHRKVWLADGGFGITGGMNLDDCMLNGVHDVMLPTIGPAVGDLATYWTRDWGILGGKLPEAEHPLDAAGMAKAAKPFSSLVDTGSHDVQVLVSDQHQAEIGHQMLALIDGARHDIKLEHAYFTDDAVIQALGRALARGVNVHVTVPEISADPFNLSNRAKILELLAAARQPHAGKLDVSFYQQNGEYRFHNHLKALVADDKSLLVGSGNIDDRGLSGSLDGGDNRLLFNRELDYLVTDPGFVQTFEHAIFDKDAQPGNTKSLYAKVAEDWGYPALAEGNQTAQTFHSQGPAAATQALLDALAKSGRAAFTAAKARVPGAGALAYPDPKAAFAKLTTALASGRTERAAATKSFAADPAGARTALLASVKRAEDALTAQLPEGLDRAVAVADIDDKRDALLAALAKAKPGEQSTWYLEAQEAEIALQSARAACLAGRDQLAAVMTKAPEATWQAEVQHALAPNPSATQKSSAPSFLY